MALQDDFADRTEAAIAQRLAKLAGMPVDTTSLDRALRRQLPAPPGASRRLWWRPLAAVAASLMLVAAIAFALLQGRAAQASAVEMAQMHRDIVSGAIPTMHADSIDEANRAIAALAGGFPQLPEPPVAHSMACCMRTIGDKKVACILLNDGGTPVTMAVADAAEVKSPHSPTTVHNGITFHIETVGDLQMVMTERQSRWICLIGAVPTEKLMDLAEAVKF